MDYKSLVYFKPNTQKQILNTYINPVEYDRVERMTLYKILKEGCVRYKGAGIAANQLGMSDRAFFSYDKLFINPDIVDRSEETVLVTEGCLSFAGINAFVKRRVWVDVVYTDVLGEQQEEHLTGINAHIFQHEIDHLDGVTIADRIQSKVQRDKFMKKYKKEYKKR
jgi:peptide deformylase